MNSFILPLDVASEIDVALIPNAIYDDTIERNKKNIENYFITHPKIMYSFVGFNSALKLSNQLASQRKCNCFYLIPWITKYQADHDKTGQRMRITFNQQVMEYRYMSQFWLPSPVISNMMYLSRIALGIIQQISLYRTYLSNNLEYCTIYTEPWYINNFQTQKQFYVYVIKYLSMV